MTQLQRPLVNPGNFCHILSLLQFLANLDMQTILNCINSPLQDALLYTKKHNNSFDHLCTVCNILAQYSQGRQGDPNDNLRHMYTNGWLKEHILISMPNSCKASEYEALILSPVGPEQNAAMLLNETLHSNAILHLFGSKYLWCEVARSGSLLKIKTIMQIPLNIYSTMISKTEQKFVNFKLVSLIIHKGTHSQSGHYLTCVLNKDTHEWCIYDDNNEPKIMIFKSMEEFNTLFFFGGDTTVQTDSTMLLYELI